RNQGMLPLARAACPFFVCPCTFGNREKAMRRIIILLLLVVPCLCGCGTAGQDIAAAREYVKGHYSNAAADRPSPTFEFKVDKVEGPEYAKIERIPLDRMPVGYPDHSAACAVRVWFTWHSEGRTVHDSWIVWVSKDHKGVGCSRPTGEKLR